MKRLATPSLGVRCIFEMACNLVYKVLCPLKAADTFREPLIFNGNKLKLEAFRSIFEASVKAPIFSLRCRNAGTSNLGSS